MSSPTTQHLYARTIAGLHDFLVERLPPVNPDQATLDIGCGTGAWLKQLNDLGFSKLYGVDLDVNQLATDVATVQACDLDYEEIPFSQMRFGFITCLEVIEHFENPGRIIRFAAEHLEPDGYFLVSTPNIHSAIARLKFFRQGVLPTFDKAKGDPTHIAPLYIDSFQKIAERHGLTLEKQLSFPLSGFRIYKRSTWILAQLAKCLMQKEIPGDTLCLLLKKN